MPILRTKGGVEVKLKFKLYEIDKDTMLFKNCFKFINKNEFIVVGETLIKRNDGFSDIDCYKMINVDDGIKILNGFDIVETAYIVEKRYVEPKGEEFIVLDIPKKYLDGEIIENIKSLNS